ncbi:MULTISPECIES: ABC transporter ATP-binding protein [Kitasatospora]|uniref:Putative ABC transporter ATP-binding protein n=1 Tax=Kitasatospora setae (strain ATCC 33774 / DSM 43861 / JCM 3304 / KCC A-0304 / NBRC 14216 / KM-6054) TaxID=452652 RepID=E4NHY4_KITSK|nr:MULTISPECIES: ABC transporter ATP-binding protein [Kitasatospora]BAJ31114.1 putative ABC transporter ATP-binding protein [Kitasatospora setae KM-6054]
MTAIVEARALGKRYGRRQALTDCTLSVPAGRIVGLVGPNGAGKSTLLQLACGLLTPTSGGIEVFGAPPDRPGSRARIGFVAQDTPVYAALSVADHLRMGARLNPRWDAALADHRIRQAGLDPAQKAGRLSGGQRAQLALALAVAKRPELLLLDEPVAALDPLARRAFLQGLMEFAADGGPETTVVLSSHLLSDLERVCDHLVVLAGGRVRAEGGVDDLLATHFRLTTARRAADTLPAGLRVLAAEHTARQSTFTVRADAPVDDPSWVMEPLGLEDLVLHHLSASADAAAAPTADPRPVPEPQR